jgi:hypothetical protein
MTYLFTKTGCSACELIKSEVDLSSTKDLQVYTLDGDNPEALAMLAYYELVAFAEKNLPILLADNDDAKQLITGPDFIKKYLLDNCM